MLSARVIEAARAALERGERFFQLDSITYRAEPLAGVGAGALPLDVDPELPCYCDACSRERQHEVGCSVHCEPAQSCDCLRAEPPLTAAV